MKKNLILITFSSIFLSVILGCTNSNEYRGQIDHLLYSNIVGGEKVEKMTDIRSSTVLLFFSGGTQGAGVCTGTLIASDIVLTAAHCTPSEERGSIVVGFGNSVEESSWMIKSRLVVVLDYRIDPLFDEKDLGKNSLHDIALLKISDKAPEGFKIRDLPQRNFVINSSDELKMIGFGRTSEGNNDAGTLHHTSVPASQITSSLYDDETKMDYAMPGNIAVLQPETGTCNGDSGGPLFVKTGEGLITLIGVASKGGNIQNDALRCHGYSIFVDIRSQLDWINNTLRDLRK